MLSDALLNLKFRTAGRQGNGDERLCRACLLPRLAARGAGVACALRGSEKRGEGLIAGMVDEASVDGRGREPDGAVESLQQLAGAVAEAQLHG